MSAGHDTGMGILPNSRILIAGCGYVGTCLGLELTKEGNLVWGLRRRSTLLPSQFAPLQADLTKPGDLWGLPQRLDYVFYTAAADSPSDPDYRAAYVVGLTNLLEAIQQQDQAPRRIFFTSSTAVYGRTDGAWVDEDSSPLSAKPSSQFLLAGERALWESPFPSTVLRLSGIYGPGRIRLIEQVRSGKAVCWDGPPVYTNRIHRDDCTGILHHLMSLEKLARIYIGTDQDPVELNVVYRWLADQLSLPHPPLKPRLPFIEETLNNKRCSNARIADTGYQFRYPTFREGYGQLLKDLS